MPHVDKLILEMLSNRTPPTCIQANIYAMSRWLLPNHDVVIELPSLKHIKNLRTVLCLVTKSLAAHSLANAKDWKQMHNDETSRHHASLTNIVMGIVTEDDEFRTICVSGSIISEDGTADKQARAIISEFDTCRRLLQEWRDKTEEMYANDPELLAALSNPDDINIAKLLNGMLNHDTCATAQSLGFKLATFIVEKGREDGLGEDQLVIHQAHCFNHLRNIWMGAVELYLTKKMIDVFKHDLELIPFQYRVACSLSELLIQVDKEYNFTANYPKGSGEAYHDWKQRFRPGKRYLPIIRVLGGNRQDSSFEGALAIYDGRADMMDFTNECLKTSENLLQQSLFIALGSMEMIAQIRVAAIMHLAVVIPMRWLAGNTHKLAHCKWGERSMGRAVDLLHKAFVKIQADGSKLLDEDFVMKIFKPLYKDLPDLKDYLDYHLEEKVGNVIGSNKQNERVKAIEEAMSELFYPQNLENRQTTEFCYELAGGVATTVLTELLHPKKATKDYLSHGGGIYSQAKITKKDQEASLGMRANNDPSEGNFATFSDVLRYGGRIDLMSAAGIGQMRYNKDMKRDLASLVTGRKSKKATKPPELGLFHKLREKLQNSLLAVSKKRAGFARSSFKESLVRQRACRARKKAALLEKKMVNVQTTAIPTSYLHQQYASPRCARTVQDALDAFEKLTTTKDRLTWVKEQILIRYLGLGWNAAHHPWSKNKYQYSPSELLQHLVNIVIPLQQTEIVPSETPVHLPTRTNNWTIGTKSADLIALDNSSLAQVQRVRLNAMLERDQLESNGYGDQLMEMQEFSWPLEKIRKGLFKIDMCFKMVDGGERMLQWCQGTVVKLIKDKAENNFMVVDVKWKAEAVRCVEEEITKVKLKKKDWNCEEHGDGVWREDLIHLTKSAKNH